MNNLIVEELEIIAYSGVTQEQTEGHEQANQAIAELASRAMDIPVGDEPFFIIRAQDKFAQSVVRQYAIMLDRNGINDDKVKSAHRKADEIAAWQEKNPARVKLPD